MKNLARKTCLALAAALTLAVAVLPAPALAWGRVGVFVGVSPFVLGGPLYGPPPVYYVPPPPRYPPPPYPPPPYASPHKVGFTCYARPYQCPLERPRRIGHPCACLALNGAPIPGTVTQ